MSQLKCLVAIMPVNSGEIAKQAALLTSCKPEQFQFYVTGYILAKAGT